MRNVPNVLTLSRVPIAFLVFFLALSDYWLGACLLSAIGLVTDALDGAIARRYGVESDLGGNVLEPVCDLILGAAAVGALIVKGYWPWWVLIPIVLVAVVLQLISNMAAKNTDPSAFIHVLKKHQNYTHPFLAVAVAIVAFAFFVVLASDSPLWIITVGLITAAVLVSKLGRARALFDYKAPVAVSS